MANNPFAPTKTIFWKWATFSFFSSKLIQNHPAALPLGFQKWNSIFHQPITGHLK